MNSIQEPQTYNVLNFTELTFVGADIRLDNTYYVYLNLDNPLPTPSFEYVVETAMRSPPNARFTHFWNDFGGMSFIAAACVIKPTKDIEVVEEETIQPDLHHGSEIQEPSGDREQLDSDPA